MRIKIWPYKMGSKSARLLARSIHALRLTGDSPTYRPRITHLVVNWGNSRKALWHDLCEYNLLNHPHAVEFASNKLETFMAFNDESVPHPDWTTQQSEAQAWVDNGHAVYVRQTLTGRSGAGIMVIREGEVPAAPLYTKRIKVKHEYRVHVFCGSVIDFVMKKKLTSEQREERGITVNSDIRNHSNGWIFAREGVILSDAVKEAAIRAVATLGLDFGAVDICEDREGNPYVFEVNTAPGLEGTTLEKYAEAIKNHLTRILVNRRTHHGIRR